MHIKKIILPTIMTIIVICILTGYFVLQKQDKSDSRNSIKIGISIYNQYDTFIASLVECINEKVRTKELEEEITIALDIANASGSQISQNDQVENFINQGCDIICINLVDRTDASYVIDMAKNANIPVIFFNRELVEEDLERWNKLYYVGAQAFESGIQQGQIIIDACKQEFDNIDKNKDGKLQYVILEGEPGHQDALIRTEYVINTVIEAGIDVEKVGDEIANWNRAQAETKMWQWLKNRDNMIEIVIANNDDMALGAIDSFETESVTNRPLVVGIDGTEEALEAVKSGAMIGTVLNDASGQAEGIIELAYSLGFHKALANEIELINGKYIRLPYVIVTSENVDEIILNNKLGK